MIPIKHPILIIIGYIILYPFYFFYKLFNPDLYIYRTIPWDPFIDVNEKLPLNRWVYVINESRYKKRGTLYTSKIGEANLRVGDKVKWEKFGDKHEFVIGV